MKKALLQYMSGMVFLVTLFSGVLNLLAADHEISAVKNQESNQKFLVEIFLSQEHKKEIDPIKTEFKKLSISKVRPLFFKLGNPPENIAIGQKVPVSVAQSAIQLALN
jgi:hypothetical protein